MPLSDLKTHGMQMMPSVEGMDTDMETPSSVWSILDLLVLNLVQQEEEVEEDLEEGLDPQHEDLNSAS